jgi:F-type H+-transporting ATPase subunit b
VINLDWTLPVASLIFLLTLWALNKLLFKPLFAVLDERRSRTIELRQRAATELEYERELMEQYHSRLREERQAGYRLSESVRATALEQRQKAVVQARKEAEQVLDQAKQRVQAEHVQAMTRLRKESAEFARMIAARVLQRS